MLSVQLTSNNQLKTIKTMRRQANAGKETFGLIIGTRAYFNSDLAIDVRKTLLEELEKRAQEAVEGEMEHE